VIEDPAMILVTLALFAAGAATIRAVDGSRSNAVAPETVSQPVA
jgi:hypothetical protein